MAQPHANHKRKASSDHVQFDHKSDPFNPYRFMHTNPWLRPDELSKGLFGMSTEMWRDYLEWVNFQQKTVQQDLTESAKWMTHCMQLSSDPNTLYRYVRMHWHKPYLELATQAFTSSRLLGKMWVDGWEALQKKN